MALERPWNRDGERRRAQAWFQSRTIPSTSLRPPRLDRPIASKKAARSVSGVT
jgi:hypothetical protein